LFGGATVYAHGDITSKQVWSWRKVYQLTAVWYFVAIAVMLCVSAAARAASAPGNSIPPADAAVTASDFFKTYDFKIVNRGWERLADGGRVHVRIYRPLVKEGKFPVIIIVPPGQKAEIAARGDRWSKSVARQMDVAEKLAEKGIAVVLYNPPGQGIGPLASSGQDGRGGYMSQDALAEVVRAVFTVDFFDKNNIGLCSEGTGLSDAAGALARYSDIKVRYLIDIEGPFDNLEMTGWTWSGITREAARPYVQRSYLYYQHLPVAEDNTDENAEWWPRREPKYFAAQMNITYYQRVQYTIDQIQPPEYYAHSLRMYESVLGSQVPHARFNHEAWDKPLPLARVPALIPGRLDDNYVEDVAAWITGLATLDQEPSARQLPSPPPDTTPLPRPNTYYYGN
jgi:hypothetical protein